MKPGTYNIEAYQGSKYEKTFRYENPDESPVDLTGYGAEMHVRRQKSSPNTLIELSVGEGIEIDEQSGEITISISSPGMADLKEGEWVYDIELIPPSGEDDRFRWLEGTFTVDREVTR